MINIPTNLDDSYQVRAFALSQAVRCVTDLGQVGAIEAANLLRPSTQLLKFTLD